MVKWEEMEMEGSGSGMGAITSTAKFQLRVAQTTKPELEPKQSQRHNKHARLPAQFFCARPNQLGLQLDEL
jgi:hypothetical protein